MQCTLSQCAGKKRLACGSAHPGCALPAGPAAAAAPCSDCWASPTLATARVSISESGAAAAAAAAAASSYDI